MVRQARKKGQPIFILMIFLTLLISAPIQPALAALVETETLINSDSVKDTRVLLNQLMAREDVRTALLSYGISPVEAKARVAAMTDEEITDLNSKLGELPRGGMAPVVYPIWLVALMLLAYIFVITGVIGGTAYAGMKLKEHQEEEYAKSTPFPAPPRVGPLPRVNPDEPWTGNWKVTEGQFKGVFSLKQDGDRVVSTKDSDQVVDSKVYGAMIWGRLESKQDFKATIASDFLSFKGEVGNRYSFEGQKIDSTASKPEPAQVTPIEPDKIKALLLRPKGWDIDWNRPGRIGEGFCLFEADGEKIVAKISIIDKPWTNLTCERDAIISSNVVKFESCTHSGIELQFDPNDTVYPFKGRSSDGIIYRLKAK